MRLIVSALYKECVKRQGIRRIFQVQNKKGIAEEAEEHEKIAGSSLVNKSGRHKKQNKISNTKLQQMYGLVPEDMNKDASNENA